MTSSIRFQYRPPTSKPDALKRPLLPVALASQTSTGNYLALIDTGADVNVLPHYVGLELGLNWESYPTAGQVFGAVPQTDTRLVRLGLQIDVWPVDEFVFAWAASDRLPLVLGTLNFLLKFDVCFFAAAGYFEITRRTLP